MAEGWVKVDYSELTKLLRDAPKQIPFAMSKALNNIAHFTLYALKWNMKRDGITLRTGWPISGIRMKNRATRSNLMADVGSIDPIMAVLAEGGDRPFRGMIPVIGPGGARETEASVYRHDLRKNQALGVEAILQQKARSPRGALRFFQRGSTIYEKTGPATKRQRGTGSRMVLSGAIVPVLRIPKAAKVHLPRRWKYQERVALTLDRKWEQAVLDAVDYALSTRTVGH